MSPKKFQYRFCAACGKKFLLKAQIKSRETRMSCSNTCRNKIIWANRRLWTEKETELLKDFAETMPLLQLVRAFNQQLTILGLPKRTRFSIRTRLQKLGYSVNTQHGVYTIGMISRHLGIPFCTVAHWVKKGWLEHYCVTKSEKPIRYITAKHLRNFARKRPQSFGGIDFVDLYLILEDKQLSEYIVDNYPRRNGRIQPQPVRCVETGKTYRSYQEAAKALFVDVSSIYRAANFGTQAVGFRFEKIQIKKKMPEVQSHINPRTKQQQPV